MEGQFIILDLQTMDYMKDKDGKVIYFDTMIEACETCGMYEFEDVWVMQLMSNYKE